jgi:acetamidase/formamidase
MSERKHHMQLPRWATTRNDTFWRRHYELATLTEQACEQVIEQQLQKCLTEIELTDGRAAAEEDDLI